MICQDIRELLSPYVDDVLSSEEKAAVDSHLARCLACRQELVSLQEVIQLVQGLEEIEPPADFRLQLHRRLIEMQLEEQKASKISWLARYRKPAWLSAAAAAACLAVGLSWGSFFGGQPANVAYNPYSQPVQIDTNQKVVEPEPIVAPNPTPEVQPTPEPIKPNTQPNNGTPEVTPEPPKPNIHGVTIEGWTGTRLCKEVEVSLQLNDNGAVAQQLKELAAGVKGDLISIEGKTGSESNAVLWVPAKDLNQTMSSLGQLGKITDLKTNQTDVTTDYNDTYSQLEKLLIEEWKLKQNPDLATNDQLKRELTKVQTDIKKAEDHMADLVESINKVTIKITLTTEN